MKDKKKNLEMENLKNKINKSLKMCTKDKLENKSGLSKLNNLLLDWAKLNNKSFVEGCQDFKLYINPKLGNIQRLPIGGSK